MKAYSRTAISFAGQAYGPGVFDADPGLYHALALRGPVRPATHQEIEAAAALERALGEAGPEAAALLRDTETAAPSRPRRGTRTLSHA